MAPKKQPAAAAKKGGNAPAAKKNTKKNNEDDELEFLNQQVKANAKANQELEQKQKEQRKKDNERKLQAEKIQKEKDAQRALAIAKLPPVYVDEACKQLYDRHGGDNQKDSFREMCWLHFALFNFFNLTVENKRKLLFRSAEHPKGEPLASYECHDLTDAEDSPHSWMVFTTASGKQYCVDLTVKQFEPKGKYGYQRDTNDAPGWQPVAGPSRLQGKEKLADDVEPLPHKGSRCKDGGVFPHHDAITTLIPASAEAKAEAAAKAAAEGDEKKFEKPDGVADGSAKAYAKFLKAAQVGRHQDMSTSEARSARILFKNKVGQLLDTAREELEDYWFTKPLAALAAAAKSETKKEE